MTDKIKLTRYRNIAGTRHESGSELTVGVDVALGQAQTLVRIGAAKWVPVKTTAAKKTKAD